MSGVRINYADVAVGAKQSFSASTDEKAYFVELSDLQKSEYVANFGNPCDLYSVMLDGMALPVPSYKGNVNMGYWSDQISNEKGIFENPIVLRFKSSEKFYSTGITITFDPHNNIYSNDLKIQWYQDGMLISEKDFMPDKASYFCENKVEYYDEIIVTFNRMNMPYNKLKMNSIDYGQVVDFDGSKLRSVKIIQEMNPISSEISINICDFTIDTKDGEEYSFQARQPLRIYFDDKLRATSFIKTVRRQSKTTWALQSEDYIGILDSVYFSGGIYASKNAEELVKEILDIAKIPYTIAVGMSDILVSGYIPFTTCRNALMHVAFAAGAVVDTSDSDTLDIYFLENNVSQTIPLERILQGQNFGDQTRVTAVEVTAHNYKPITDILDVYDAEQDGTGEDIFVTFSEPLYGVYIKNGTILEVGNNYAIINANAGCVLSGRKFEHTTTVKRKDNPLVLPTDTENIVSVKDATLVSSNNIDKILDLCYNYFVKTNTVNLRIVEGKHETDDGILYDKETKVGDLINAETEYLGDIEGRIIKQSFNLNGRIIVKDTVMR